MPRCACGAALSTRAAVRCRPCHLGRPTQGELWPERECRRCGEALPADEEFYRPGAIVCEACRSERERLARDAYRAAHPDRRSRRGRDTAAASARYYARKRAEKLAAEAARYARKRSRLAA